MATDEEIETDARRRWDRLCDLMGWDTPWELVGKHIRKTYRAEARRELEARSDV